MANVNRSLSFEVEHIHVSRHIIRDDNNRARTMPHSKVQMVHVTIVGIYEASQYLYQPIDISLFAEQLYPSPEEKIFPFLVARMNSGNAC